MIVERQLSAEAQEAASKIEKILRLAARNTNEAEAAAAIAKANEMMEAWNLDQATVEENAGEAGKRADEKLKGGHYEFQRDLWSDVAELNFCLYFNVTAIERIRKWVPNKTGTGFLPSYKDRRVRQHRVVGRLVNTRMTRVMAQYLEGAVERILEEQLIDHYGIEDADKYRYSKQANSFREGVVERLCAKIGKKRREYMAEERRKAEDAAEKARAAGFDGVSTETALTVASFAKSEKDANDEFLNPGILERRARWKAEEAAARAEQARLDAEWEAEQAAWALAHPEEARRQAEEAEKERLAEEKRKHRNAQRRESYYQNNGYRARSYGTAYKGDMMWRKMGYEAGANISIDQQADHRKAAGELG